MTERIDGRALATALKGTISDRIQRIELTPLLCVVLVGHDPASEVYVRNKAAAAMQTGIATKTIRLNADITQNELYLVVAGLSGSPEVDGIMVQLPLPSHIDKAVVLDALDPSKDVDGFHPLNVGRMTVGQSGFTPCTPMGIMRLLAASQTPLQGAQALVIGNSAIVGRPVSTLLSQAQATVTTAHKLTRDLPTELRRADVIVVAAGCANLVRGDAVKPGVTIIDVGINRLADGRLCGDVAYDECLGIARAITPVPGGVGPMTVACLLENTLTAAIQRRA